jgi:hypothetical protein
MVGNCYLSVPFCQVPVNLVNVFRLNLIQVIYAKIYVLVKGPGDSTPLLPNAAIARHMTY